MTLRKEISSKVLDIIHGDFPDEFYCEECGLMIINEETAGMVEEKFGEYCDICGCGEPKSCQYEKS